VAWVAEREDVLSTFFVMLTLGAYHYYVQRRSQKPDRPSRVSIFHLPSSIFYVLSVLFFVCGLMSKPMVITLPLLLLLLDYWPLKRWEPAAFVARPGLAARLLLEKLPFVMAALLTSFITLHAASRRGSLPSVAECPIMARVANATLSYAGYLLQAFWPGDLAVFYPFPATISVWSVAAAALLLLGISVTAFCLARRWPYVMVGWLWYLATLLPVIGLIQLAGYSHADRYTYVPLIGVFVLLVWGAHDVTQRWRYGGAARSVAGCAAIVLCLVVTRQQLGNWKDSETLYRHALAVTENNYLAHNNLGNTLDEKGQTDEAIRQFQEAIRAQPSYAEAYNNLGAVLDKQGQTDEAIRQFQEAIHVQPSYADAHNNLSAVLDKKGQIDEAIRQYQEALRLKPDYAEAHNNLGSALDKQGQTDEAIRQFQEALRLKPDYAEAHNNLGSALDKQGQTDEAIRQFQEALRLKPDYANAHNNFGSALDKQGRTDEAIRQFQEALRLKPEHAEAHNNLGSALDKQGQTDEAIRQFQEALRLKPDDAEIHYNLGVVLDKKSRTDEAIRQYQEAIRLKPDDADAHCNLGIVFYRQGQTDEAIRQYQEAIRLKPNAAKAHNNLGIALDRQGQTAEAIRQFQEALRLQPGAAETHNNLGIALDRQGQTDGAIRQFQEALRLQPDYFRPHLALAQMLTRLGRLQDAAFHMEEFLRVCPGSNLESPNSPIRERAAGALNDLAWFLATSDRAEDRDCVRAVRFAERACKLTQYRQTALVSTLAAAYAEAGRFQEAIQTAQQARDLAQAAGQPEVAEKNRQLLELYRSGKAYRNPPPAPGASGHTQ
jgi:tetratricopeptide (TPR) repeat protein